MITMQLKKIKKDKKASAFANTMLFLLFVVVAVGLGAMTNWYGLAPEKAAGTGIEETPTGKEGDLGTLKYSVKTVSDKNPAQFAGTGYCWDTAKPNRLIESLNGKTLSASAGTTFSPAYRDHTYECTAFSTSHWCDHDSGLMTAEGLELRSSCYNITSTPSDVTFSFFEQGTKETTNSLDIGAGATKTYNKWALEITTAYKNLKIAAICMGTNVSDSHVNLVTIGDWKSVAVPKASIGASVDDYCFVPSQGTITLTPYGYIEFTDSIKFEGDSTGTTSEEELWTFSLMPECEYVSIDGSIKTGFYKDNADMTLCDDDDINSTITLS